MNHLVKDLFLFAQHKDGYKGFGKLTKGLMTLSIQEGSDTSLTTLSGKLWRQNLEHQSVSLHKMLEKLNQPFTDTCVK